MPQCLVGLGSNLGKPKINLERAVEELHAADGVSVTGISSWYSSEPIGGPSGQGLFLNGAVTLETDRDAAQLLCLLHETESALGRRRKVRWEPRVVDLDLLLYDELVIDNNGLRVPHPWMAIRPFVLSPAAEIAAEWIHPEIQWTISQLWEHATRSPKIIVIVNSTDALFSELSVELSDILRLSPIRLPHTDPLLPSGFHRSEAVELALGRSRWLSERLDKLKGIGTDAILADGWWDLLSGDTYGQQDSPTAIHIQESLAEVQRTCGLPVPHVVVALTGRLAAESGSPSQRDGLNAYVRRPEGGPFLCLEHNDLSALAHDLHAIVGGYLAVLSREGST